MRQSEFERLYLAQFDRVYRYVLAMTRNKAQAEEIAQDAFLRLFRNGSRVTIQKPEAWLFRVARNLVLDHVKKDHDYPDSSERGTLDPEQLLYRSELRERVLEAVGRLPLLQRECLTLRTYGETRLPEHLRNCWDEH